MVAIMVASTAPAEDDASSAPTLYLPGLWSAIWNTLRILEAEAIAERPHDPQDPDFLTDDQARARKAKIQALYADLAARAGVTLAQFGAILTGSEPVANPAARALAVALNCSMGKLLEDA